MLIEVPVYIKGVTPTLQNCNTLANPLNTLAKRYKELSSKQAKKRTDADHMELCHVQFLGALYLNEAGRVIWPGNNIEAMLKTAAKEQRKGKACDVGLSVPDDPELIYEGPKDAEGLWKDQRFPWIRLVRNQKTNSTTLTCSPRFDKWELKFTLLYNDEELNKEEVALMLKTAGEKVGLSGFRPRFGRFVVL